MTSCLRAPFPERLDARVRRFSIITVCRNAEASIGETMRSVLQQTAVLSGRVELEYLVQDGMSTDRTLEIVEALRTPAVSVVAEPDSGLYDGLSRATQRCTGDVVAYLNAGDYYHPCALDVVIDIMEQHLAPWLTGMTVVYNHRSQVIECSTPYLLPVSAESDPLRHVWHQASLHPAGIDLLACQAASAGRRRATGLAAPRG